MRTSRVISNISYNTSAFLNTKLLELEENGIIDWAYWIYHQADTDDTKNHCHLVLKPSKAIDTHRLYQFFLEIDLNSAKPLGVTKKWFFTSSISDWLLYAVHDNAYLNSKNLKRNFHYSIDDVLSTDFDALNYDWANIDRTKFDRLAILKDAVYNHKAFFELVQDGLIPIAQRAQYELQYKALAQQFYNEFHPISEFDFENDIDFGEKI